MIFMYTFIDVYTDVYNVVVAVIIKFIFDCFDAHLCIFVVIVIFG